LQLGIKLQLGAYLIEQDNLLCCSISLSLPGDIPLRAFVTLTLGVCEVFFAAYLSAVEASVSSLFFSGHCLFTSSSTVIKRAWRTILCPALLAFRFSCSKVGLQLLFGLQLPC